MQNILLVGVGRMGFAMLKGWTSCGGYSVTAIEPNKALGDLAEDLGASIHASSDTIRTDFMADTIVIATKPEQVVVALASTKKFLRSGGLVLSVAAGISTSTICQQLPSSVDVIRCMPNLPSFIGEGMTACYAKASASCANVALAERLMGAIGRVIFIRDEALLHAVTAVSGSGLAYVFHLIEALCASGVSLGLDEDMAMLLAKQTIVGAAKMASLSNDSSSSLREQVTSPNGTTAAAMEILLDPTVGLSRLFDRAIHAAYSRSVELGARPT